MKLKFLLLFLSSLFLVACSSSDESTNSKTFRFLDLDQDVFLQKTQPSEISFLALDFDTDLSKWDISLANDNNTIDCSISKIEQTGAGYNNTSSKAQRIFLKTATLPAGFYTLIIKNKISNQIYSETFKVVPTLFSSIQHESVTSYHFEATASNNNILFFQGANYTIDDLAIGAGVQSVTLENRETFVNSSINFTVVNSKVTFKIPNAVQPGNYFLAVKNINGTTAYFSYDLLIVEEKKPVITNVNKTVLSSGEALIITGTNLRYLLNDDAIPSQDLLKVRVPLWLEFTNFKGIGHYIFDVYSIEPQDFKVNETGTQITFMIPKKVNAYFFNDFPTNSFFEGTITILSGPFKSSPINVKMNYN
ncbi:hypothetical protein [Flavobacterium turcicum]|uniref:IPT/TIG domain-containing protein n=1 Tax=Flavobacterium turcicum TaxID=2764718 RepID=A0ABR7JCJ8_9FLAO|nr:hypothetical protein [Flavobacterium turcicum]MBC5862220.1 hypothetical protein [Flavobacterium turcicum]NHL00951.1 hypothetical protein [Flavobacterium turcicum]